MNFEKWLREYVKEHWHGEPSYEVEGYYKFAWDSCKEEVLKIIKENKEVSGIDKYGLNEGSFCNMVKEIQEL